MKQRKLEDKVGLIIGDANKKSRDLAVSLAEYGADIAILYGNDDHAMASAIKNDIEVKGQRCFIVHRKDNQLSSLKAAMRQIVERVGSFDFFISYPQPTIAPQHSLLAFENGSANGNKNHLSRSLLAKFLPNFQATKVAMQQMIDR